MSWSQDRTQITTGTDVFGSDGQKVGTITEVASDYVVVEKGFFFPTDYYIPITAFASMDDGRAYLHVTKDAALHRGWDTVPETPAALSDTGSEEYATAQRARRGGQPQTAAHEVTGENDIVIPVREEELTATVRPREAGAVRIEKRIVEEDRVLDVPVSEEQVRVKRRVVDRPVGPTDSDAFEEIVVEVPLTAEQVELQKQARVAEEIIVSKEAVEHTERVRGTVRREEVDVDESTLADPSLPDRAPGDAQAP